MTVIKTKEDFDSRQRDFESEEKIKRDEKERERKNIDFTQVYPMGWSKIRELIEENPPVVKLYSFFCEHVDSSLGAVVCSQEFLAKKMSVSVRTIQRWVGILEKQNALAKIPIAGRVYAYSINPELVWRGYNNGKSYAAFAAKTLVGKDGDIQRRLKLMFKEHQKANEVGGPSDMREI